MIITIQTAPVWKVKYQEWLDNCREVLGFEPAKDVKIWTLIRLQEIYDQNN